MPNHAPYIIVQNVRGYCAQKDRRISKEFVAELNAFIGVKLQQACARSGRTLSGDDLRSPAAPTVTRSEPFPGTETQLPVGFTGNVNIRRDGDDWVASYAHLSARAPSKPVTQASLRRGEYDLGILDARKALCEINPNLWEIQYQVKN